ncbi:MAG: VPLPA-CTERM sorting domain-containing protein [Proteobacteria bacterium]|nr:VPLPA-CTERM sorting domain-containing protein [Pseudomonadota bacterium]
MKKLSSIVLLAGLFCGTAQADFSGTYDISWWTLGGPLGNNDGSVDISSAPGTISLLSNNTGIAGGNQDFTFTAVEDATISFDWSFSTIDTGTAATHGNQWDPFGYLLGGSFTQLSDDTGAVNSGSVSFSVSIGDIFGFRATTVDGIFGSSTTSISNFSAAVVPLPPSMSLMGCAFGGLVLIQRRRKQDKVVPLVAN